MINTSPLPDQTPRWQRELAAAVTDPRELCRLLELDPELALGALSALSANNSGPDMGAQFPLRVPLAFVARMRRGDPSDPLLRQVLPERRELHSPAHYSADPLAEADALRAPGLLHKYQGRALLVATPVCAIHCRYCFRREFPYQEQQDAAGRWNTALGTLAADASIEELILSGGDPLSLSDGRLRTLTDALRAIPHLQRLRIHTRQPIVLPSRVDAGLCAWLRSLPWSVVIVVHANHANEIDDDVRAAMALLRAAGVTLLNQSVLLAGVNDSVAALTALSKALWSAGVLPYYLHLLDTVRGAAHFEVDEPRARLLAGELAAQLPGYLVPRLVRETAGLRSKMTIAPIFGPSSRRM
jgi:L-lysine 2,3-aminomutase